MVGHHQGSISSTFYEQLLHAQILKVLKRQVKLSVFLQLSGSVHVKPSCRMLMKLTPGLNFINIQHTAFTLTDSKRVKIQSSCQSFFMLSGSTNVKAVHKMLMKLTPGCCYSIARDFCCKNTEMYRINRKRYRCLECRGRLQLSFHLMFFFGITSYIV